MRKPLGRSTTEASGITAIALAVSLFASGEHVSGAAVFGVGVFLIIAYEVFGIENLKVSEEEMESVGEQAEEEYDEYMDER